MKQYNNLSSVLSALQIITHLINSMDEEMEVHKGEVTCLRLWRQQVVEPRLEPRQSDFRAYAHHDCNLPLPSHCDKRTVEGSKPSYLEATEKNSFRQAYFPHR